MFGFRNWFIDKKHLLLVQCYSGWPSPSEWQKTLTKTDFWPLKTTCEWGVWANREKEGSSVVWLCFEGKKVPVSNPGLTICPFFNNMSEGYMIDNQDSLLELWRRRWRKNKKSWILLSQSQWEANSYPTISLMMKQESWRQQNRKQFEVFLRPRWARATLHQHFLFPTCL